jgi:hypothetical protein
MVVYMPLTDEIKVKEEVDPQIQQIADLVSERMESRFDARLVKDWMGLQPRTGWQKFEPCMFGFLLASVLWLMFFSWFWLHVGRVL